MSLQAQDALESATLQFQSAREIHESQQEQAGIIATALVEAQQQVAWLTKKERETVSQSEVGGLPFI